jgi:hypothetical protein
MLEWTPEELQALATKLIDVAPDETEVPGLKKRLQKDAERLLAAIDPPSFGDMLAFSFENRGIESYTFTHASETLDHSEPLSILTHRGTSPIVAIASHAALYGEEYGTVVTFLREAYSYVDDFVVPRLDPDQKMDFNRVVNIVMPFIVSLHENTRDKLIPAVDGSQGLQVMDGGGELKQLPGGKQLTPVVPVPRIGLAMQLKDPTKFVAAIHGYVDATRALVRRIRRNFPNDVVANFEIPSPRTAEFAGGTLYFYPLPADMGADVFPCALLKGSLLVLASSKALAEEMAGAAPMPKADVADPTQAAGMVTLVDLEVGRQWLVKLSDAVFMHMQQERVINPRDVGGAMMVKMHVDALWRSLKVFRSYCSTATREGDHLVMHSWLHVEDVAE